MKTLTLLGSTGSIGVSTLDVVDTYPEKFKVEVLTAGANLELFIQQCQKFKPRFAAMNEVSHEKALKQALPDCEVVCGEQAVIDAAKIDTDWTMSAIVGAAGLKPTLEAIKRGTIVALSNKESIVCAGHVMMEAVRKHGAKLLPVDSEHNALFQLFEAGRKDVEKVFITASGGPFRTWSIEEMKKVTPAQAIAHPNWSMGAKNSIDSATLMNKGLELIEAAILFDLKPSELDALIHPQSLFHGLIAYKDGSHLAQFGATDMRLPIAHTLGWPERIVPRVKPLSLIEALASSHFEAVDHARFPSLRLAQEALHEGQNAPTLLNAANEIAVGAFLQEKIGFLDIYKVVEEALAKTVREEISDIDDVFENDALARRTALDIVAKISR